jgi:hypothetical protein
MAVSKMIVTVIMISLVALAGCSDDSTPVSPAATVDTAPPAAPQNFDVSFDGDSAQLSWDANVVDSDLAGYIVTREHYGETEALVATPQMLTSFSDPSPLPGANRYAVYAVDTSGNESAVAAFTLAVALSKPVDAQRQ